MSKFLMNIPIVAVVSALMVAAFLSVPVGAGEINVFPNEACNGDTTGICGDGADSELTAIIGVVIRLMIFVAGIIAVIMIIIGGIKYATSNGDSSSISSAKNTILYAVIGLAVAIMSFAIVNFVLDQFQAAGNGSEDGGSSQRQSQGENGDTENSTPQQPNLARPGVPVAN